MSESLFDLAVKITADTAEFSKGVNNAKKSMTDLGTVMKKVAVGDTQAAYNKLGVLAAQYRKAQAEVAKLTAEFNKSAKEKGFDSVETQNLAAKLNNAENKASSLEKAQKDLTRVLNGEAEQTQKAEKQTDLFATGLKKLGSVATKIPSALASVAAAAGKVALGMTAAVTVVASGVGVMTKAAISGYAEYEQLQGGVAKLYGAAGMTIEQYAKSVGKSTDEVKDKYNDLNESTKIVMQNATDAYKNVGMSANEYMQIATGFSATLISSLSGDTVEAAKLTDEAMKAISDNVNTFGSDMGSVTNAFQGFAKQNFTMLDNLKLGYGGTKTEMERLIQDASQMKDAQEKLGLTVDSTSMSFDNIVKAIQVVQKEQGIWGTTSKEAAKTVQGSMQMLSGAWQNLMAGFANPDLNLDTLIGNVVEAGTTVMRNLTPVIERALIGIGQMFEKLAPIISERLPGVIEGFLPSLLSAATTLITTLMNSVPSLISSTAPTVISAFETVLDSLTTVTKEFFEKIPEWVSEIDWGELGEIGGKLSEAMLSASESLLDTGLILMQNVADGMSTYDWTSAASNIATWLTNALTSDEVDTFISAGTSILSSLVDGMGQAYEVFAPVAPEIITSIITSLIDNLDELIDGGIKMAEGLAQGMMDGQDAIIEQIPTIIESIASAILANAPKLIITWFKIHAMLIAHVPQLVAELIVALVQSLASILNQIVIFGQQVITQTISIGSKVLTAVVNFLSKLPERIAYWVGFAVSKFVTTLAELPKKVKEKFDDVMTNAREFFEKFKTEGPKKAKEMADDFVKKMKELPGKIKGIGKDVVEKLKEGISNAWGSFVSWLLGKLGSIGSAWKKGAEDGKKDGKSTSTASTSSVKSVSSLNVASIASVASVGGSVVVANRSKNGEEENGIDYDKLANAVVKAFGQSDFSMEIDGREFGRVVRKAVAY